MDYVPRRSLRIDDSNVENIDNAFPDRESTMHVPFLTTYPCMDQPSEMGHSHRSQYNMYDTMWRGSHRSAKLLSEHKAMSSSLP